MLHKTNTAVFFLSRLTCRLLLRLPGLQRLLFRSQLDEQSKKLQSSSLLQFCSRMSLILGSKKAMSTSMATTCRHSQIRAG